ncbi:pyocin activator PrtN family protein [Chromobacterium haemolyticum]|uniref:pyocin activator PrtN family protein n=1 Tax=Chromobacterium haemolyticum TaxID=394935 RepID=UPI0017473752|nr:pyocin activator PrtN family protein [Chromobacterium haemolyticum]QOD81854.1 pyocin activator PrtN family protein [Chromobacterium haemolyticum]
MNTAFLLMAQYQRAAVPLNEISEDYLGLTARKANEMASLNRLPLPTFRASDSQKAPRMVHIADLAAHLDRQREEAKKQWERSQTI